MSTIFKRIMGPAFTLIELVITITVIGILSAALIATYASLSQSAQKAAQEATLSSLQSQIAIHLGASPIHQFPTMLELQQTMTSLNIATHNITPATSIGSTPATTTTIATPFMLYPGNNNNQLGSTRFIFYVDTSAGALVFVPFADSTCKFPLGALPVIPASSVAATAVTGPSNTTAPVTTVPVNAPVVSASLTINGGTDGTTLGYSLNDYIAQNPGIKTYPTAPVGAQIQCVRIANATEMNQNFSLITGLGVTVP